MLAGWMKQKAPLSVQHTHSQSLWRTCLTRKIKNPLPAKKNHTVLDDGLNMEDESKIPIGNRKRIFWQTSINHQRPKLRVCINDIVIKGLLDTGVDMSSIIPESWHPDWPLQEADIQFLGTGNLSQVKQGTRWVECIGQE